MHDTARLLTAAAGEMREREDEARARAVDRVFEAARGAFDLFTIYLGNQLGFYRVLAEEGPLTPGQLARRSGAQERYVREWLEQQTVAGWLVVDADGMNPEERQYDLAPGRRDVLANPEHLDFMAPLAQAIVGATRPLDAVLAAYRDGGGVAMSAYGRDFREGQGRMNRALLLHQLGQEWLPAIPDVHARLLASPPARVADIGCGVGWASIGIARCYPNATVDGFDLDAPSIELARANAVGYGVHDRVTFAVRDAADPTLAGQYDLVIAFECVHDMCDPVGTLRTLGRMAGARGTVLVVDERVGERFTPQGQDLEWLMYGFSVLCCLPVGMCEPPAAGTGTVMRIDTLRRYASEAGFAGVEVMPIDHPLFRVYRMVPRR